MSEILAPPPSPPPAPPPPPAISPLPWEERQRLGAIPALVETLRILVLEPQAGFARMREQGDWASPLLFGVICSWVGIVAAQLWSLALGPLFWLPFPGALGDRFGEQAVGGGLVLGFQLVFAPVFALIGLFIGGAVVHLFLWMLGGLGGSRAGFEGTVRVLSYSAVAQIANAVPFVGAIAALVWGVVLQVIGLARVHRTTPGRAVAAVLMPLVLCCGCLLFFAAGLAAMIAWLVATSR